MMSPAYQQQSAVRSRGACCVTKLLGQEGCSPLGRADVSALLAALRLGADLLEPDHSLIAVVVQKDNFARVDAHNAQQQLP